MWLDKPEQWIKLATALRKAGELGVDTETYNQPDKTSPQWRTRIHCWSVGILTADRSPRGYRMAVGRVLPRAALDHPAIREVLADPSVVKFAHNAPHDEHSFLNENVPIVNLQDSLQLLRVACPGVGRYGLKEAEGWALGLPPRPSFIDTVSYVATVKVAKSHRIKGCVCGQSPCRARSTSDYLDPYYGWRPHTRVTWRHITCHEKQVPARWEVPEFVPGHPRWDDWLAYSLADAVRGIMLVDWIRNRKKPKVAYPWRDNVEIPAWAVRKAEEASRQSA